MGSICNSDGSPHSLPNPLANRVSNAAPNEKISGKPGRRGFTLLEMMLALVLLGILLYLALPAYQLQVIAANRGVGVAQLLGVVAQQEQFYGQHGRYAGSFPELGYPQKELAIDSQGGVVDALDERRVYRFSLSTAEAGFTLHGVPQLLQAKDVQCQTLGINALGLRSVSGRATTQKCWQ